MAVLVARYFLNGWIREQYHEPGRFFSWPGCAWIQPWPAPWMEVHFAVLGALALSIAAGLFTRASVVLFGLGFTYVHLIDKANYLNHYYLVSLLCLLLAFMPLGREASIDARRGRRRGRAPPFRAWMLAILRFQVGAVYFFAGVAKLQPDWLLRAQPLRLWLSRLENLPLVGAVAGEPWAAYLLSWGGALFDLAIPFLLSWSRTRTAAFAALVVFHAATALLFPIGLFPWIMIASALVFFPPEALRRLWPAAPEHAARWTPAAAAPSPGPARRALVTGLLAAHVLVQVALPLRSRLHGGDVLWTEEGFRFSWRVMLIDKAAAVRFFVRDGRTGAEREVRPGDYLTPAQVHFMSTQPDMIRDFARMLRAELEGRGESPTEVRAEVRVSLNGRPSRAMIDPRADLAAVPYRPGQNRWILPLSDADPPSTSPSPGRW